MTNPKDAIAPDITLDKPIIAAYKYDGNRVEIVRRPNGRDAKIAFLIQDKDKTGTIGFTEGLLSRIVKVEQQKISPEAIGEWDADFTIVLETEVIGQLHQFPDPRNPENGYPRSFKFASQDEAERILSKIFDRYPGINLAELKKTFLAGGSDDDREFAIQEYEAIVSPVVTQVESRKTKHNTKAQKLATATRGSNTWAFEFSLALASKLLQIDGKQLSFDEFFDLDINLILAISEHFLLDKQSQKKPNYTRLKH